MALPKNIRLKGHRTFDYIHKNSIKFYGKLMNIKIARSNPNILISHKNNSDISNFKIAITISKKFSKKSVVRNRIRRLMHKDFLNNFKKAYNHNPYWVLVNLKSEYYSNNDDELLREFQSLLSKSKLLK